MQELNLYREGLRTHYNQELVHCTLGRCWTQCLKDADYHRRLQEIKAFNRCDPASELLKN